MSGRKGKSDAQEPTADAWVILMCFLALLGLGTTAAWFFLPPLTLRVAIGPMGSDNQKLLAAFVRGWEDAHPRVRMKLVSTTDAVTWRLVSRSSLPNYATGELARLLFITRSKLVTMFPQAGSIEAPDTDKSGALPVHPGAAAYFTAWRGSGPHQEREQLQRLMTIFREAPAVGQEALDIFEKEVDEVVAWALERTADGAMQAGQFQVFSLVVTQVRQSIERRRERRGLG